MYDLDRALARAGVDKTISRFINGATGLRKFDEMDNSWVRLARNLGFDYDDSFKNDPFFSLSNDLQKLQFQRRISSRLAVHEMIGLPTPNFLASQGFNSADIFAITDDSYDDLIDTLQEFHSLGRIASEVTGPVRAYRKIGFQLGDMVTSMLNKGVEKHLQREKQKIRGRISYENNNLSQSAIEYLYRYDPTIFPVYDSMFEVFPTQEEALTFMRQEKRFKKVLHRVGLEREAFSYDTYAYEGEALKINNIYNTMQYMYNRSNDYDIAVDFISTRILPNVFETMDDYIDFEAKYYEMLNAGYKSLRPFMYHEEASKKSLFPKNKWERKNERLEKNQRKRAQRQRDKFEEDFLEEYGYELPF